MKAEQERKTKSGYLPCKVHCFRPEFDLLGTTPAIFHFPPQNLNQEEKTTKATTVQMNYLVSGHYNYYSSNANRQFVTRGVQKQAEIQRQKQKLKPGRRETILRNEKFVSNPTQIDISNHRPPQP